MHDVLNTKIISIHGLEINKKPSIPFTKYRGRKGKLKACQKRGNRNTWPFLDITQRESPAFATKSWLFRIIATHAVLPEVGPWKLEWGPWYLQNKIYFSYTYVLKMSLTYYPKTSNINNSQYAKSYCKSFDNRYLRIRIYMINETTWTPVLNLVNYTAKLT